MNIKKIIKTASIVLAIISIILCIITLVNYYQYANTLENLQTTDLDLLKMFELQEDRDAYLYRTLNTLPWTVFISIFSAILSSVSIILNHNRNIQKIR